jgi:hypothetical protein
MRAAPAARAVTARRGRVRRSDAVRALLSPWTRAVAPAVLAFAWLWPATGIDAPLCWLRALTGLPCVGCGLGRSVALAARGHVVEALGLHAFGPAVVAGCAGLLALAAAAALRPVAVARGLLRRRELVRRSYRLLLAAFIVYGALRAIAYAVAPERLGPL